MRTLITGGAGFIGFHLASHLADAGHEVVILDNLSRGIEDFELTALLNKDNVSLETVDLMDSRFAESLQGEFDAIYHMAAVIGVAHVMRQPYQVLVKNAVMTANLLDYARSMPGLKRFIAMSTSEISAHTLTTFGEPIPTPEDVMLVVPPLDKPRSSYMLSKAYTEALCLHGDVPFTVFRPFNIYGPRMGMAHVIPELLRRAYEAEDGSELTVYSPTHTRTFCFVQDAVNMLAKCPDIDDTGNRVLNLGNSGPEIAMADLAELVTATVGRELTIAPAEETEGSVARRCPEMSTTFSLMDYSPRYTLEQGVGETFAWYRDNIFTQGKECTV